MIKMEALAAKFPSVKNTPGIDPWDPIKVVAMLAKPLEVQKRVTLKYLLHAANYQGKVSYRWDIYEAMKAWDETHRRAFNEGLP